MMDRERLAGWVEQSLGGRITEWTQQEGGKSRGISRVIVRRADEVLDLIVRQDIAAGPQHSTAFTMRREAHVMQALEHTDIRLPRVLAVAPDGDAIIMQRLEGQAAIPPEAAPRMRLIESFVEQLVALHALDAGRLRLPVPVASLARDGALRDLDDWHDSYQRLCIRHDIFEEGFDWLYTQAPATRMLPCVVHGDAGPGNFLHSDGVVTGLVDWEFAHLGDPHEDLAWIWFRVNVIKQDLEARSYFERYLSRSRLDYEPKRCIYYIAQTVMRCAVACGVRQAHDPTRDDTRPAQLRALLALALADAREHRLTRLPALPA